MRIGSLKLVGLVLGGVLVGAMVSASAQDAPPSPGKPNRAAQDRAARQRPHPPKGPPMRSESVFAGVDGGGIRTVRTDNGTVSRVEDAAVVLHEKDGTDVTIPVDQNTRIMRDGEQAKLGDLKAGDEANAIREKVGDAAFTTKGVRAISPERRKEMETRQAEMRQQREACKADAAKCREQMQQRRQACRTDRQPCPRGPGPGPRGRRGPGRPAAFL